MPVLHRSDPLLHVLGPLPARGRSVGVEEEWCVHGATGRVDYRDLHDRVTSGLSRFFPGDPSAVMTAAGTVLTVDGWEAETVTPPIELGPGTLAGLDAALVAARTDLRERLLDTVPDVRLDGWSTHLSVTVDDDDATSIATRLRERCGRSLPLLVGAGPSGILLRPRRHRLEICLDHLERQSVRRSVVAWAGLVLMCSDGSRGAGWRSLPRVSTDWTPARERYGHHAPTDRSGSRAAAADVWGAARRYAVRAGLPAAQVDRLVRTGHPHRVDLMEQCGSLPRAPDLGPRMRPFGPVHARWLTWDLVAWECGDPGVTAVLPLHANHLFVAALDEGRLDELMLLRLSRLPARGRRSPEPSVRRSRWARRER